MQSFLRNNLTFASRYQGFSCNQTFQQFSGRFGHLRRFASIAPPKASVRASSVNPNAIGRWIGVGTVTVAAVGLHLTLQPRLKCEPTKPVVQSPSTPAAYPAGKAAVPEADEPMPPAVSALNMYELSFGTVCGICAGVFVKKGAKLVAFVLGGAFVLMQYLASMKYVNINWARVNSSFEKRFYETPAGQGQKAKPPTVGKVWNGMMNFLLADFPPRATFVAGFILGLRIG